MEKNTVCLSENYREKNLFFPVEHSGGLLLTFIK